MWNRRARHRHSQYRRLSLCAGELPTEESAWFHGWSGDRLDQLSRAGGLEPVTFRLREHTADVAVEATGESLEETFAAVAAGLSKAHCDSVPEDVGEWFSLAVQAESLTALLFDYLDELIYQRDVQNVLPVDHGVSIDRSNVDGADAWSLEATARGVPVDVIDAREIKAVTYSEMVVEETSTGWRAYVVFDV